MNPLYPLPNYRFIVTLDPVDTYKAGASAVVGLAGLAGGGGQLPIVGSALGAASAASALVGVAAFSAVSGLSGSLEVLAHPEGGQNDYVHQLPVRHTWAPLVFKKGVMLTGGLWSWFESTLHGFKNVRRDGAVILVEPDGTPVIGWSWQKGLPVKWSGPELNAQEGAVAIQSIEIVHHGLRELSAASLASGLVGKFTR